MVIGMTGTGGADRRARDADPVTGMIARGLGPPTVDITGGLVHAVPCPLDAPMDIVTVVLDDARFDQLEVLTETLQRLRPHAVEFSRAYVTTPLCCPERASFLSGGYYPHQVGVLNNTAPNGGATAFADADTLPVTMQRAGYTTALVGKYLNEYEQIAPRVPPGWTLWAVNDSGQGWTDFSAWVGSSGPDAPTEARVERYDGYITGWMAAEVRPFLAADQLAPRWLYLSLRAPHHPHEPAAADLGAYAGFQYRDRAWNEDDVSDKPAWIQALPPFSDEAIARADLVNEERLESLLAVDRLVANLIDAVDAAGRSHRTVFVISSDNGAMLGEHRLVDKGVGYEEAVRVPLLVAHPALAPRVTSGLVAMNLDLAATVLALGGQSPVGEGRSLLPALCGEDWTGRTHVNLQGWPGEGPAWAGLVTPRYSYLETAGGDRELYDLDADPYQESSLHAQPEHAELVGAYAATVAAARGLALTTEELPRGRVGRPYDTILEHWGGEEPVSFSLVGGELPPGVELGARGRLTGTPTRAGKYMAEVAATDTSTSPYTGSPQSVRARVALRVETAGPHGAGDDGASGCDGGSGGLLVGTALLWARRRLGAGLAPPPP